MIVLSITSFIGLMGAAACVGGLLTIKYLRKKIGK